MKTDIPFKKRVQLNLHRAYRKSQAALHELSYLFWESTLRCNINCLHCGSDCRKESDVKDMPLEDFVKVLEKVKSEFNPNKVMVVVTGGEPLMRADLEQCGLTFYRMGFPWGFVTNGYGLNRKRFETLLASGLHSLTISLDGIKESHNWLRGKRDSFDKALKAITMAAAHRELTFDVVTCINDRNFGELEDIKRLLINREVRRWRIFNIFPKGRAAENRELDISPDNFLKLMEFIRATNEEGNISLNYSCEAFLGRYEGIARENLFFCRAGINVGSVLADGSISACPSLRGDYIQGNIYQDDFIKVWEERFQVMRNRKWTKSGDCAHCEVYKWCEGNGLHLREEQGSQLLRCHYKMLKKAGQYLTSPSPK